MCMYLNRWVTLTLVGMSLALNLLAWDYEGHRLVNQAALLSLPTNFPAFVHLPAARERIAFLGGEADRWRNTPELTFRHQNNPDHFLDIEDLALLNLDPENLPAFRYEFVAVIARARILNPDRFPRIDPHKDTDRTRALPGFLPWTITEHYGKLKSAFSYLRAFEENGGTPQELDNARQNILYVMGVMGHFVADAAQPLHTTKHYNGWVGSNPHRYTTNRAFHGWIDGGVMDKSGLRIDALAKRIQPAAALIPDSPKAETNMFSIVMKYLVDQSKLVEPLYQLEKAGKLKINSEVSPEGREFITQQLLKAAQMLGNIWWTAWKDAPPDKYLTEQLEKRQQAGGNQSSPGK